MKFEDYAREASRALSASGRSVDVPAVPEMWARRRRRRLVLGSTAIALLAAGTVTAVATLGGLTGDGEAANGSASQVSIPAATMPVEGGGILFGPPRIEGADEVEFPITLLDGTRLSLTLPQSLAADIQGLVPGGAASWRLDPCCARSLDVMYGSVDDLYGDRQPDVEYEDADGNPVGFFTEEDGLDYLVFQYGSWVVRAWDDDAEGRRFTEENRAMFASLMRGHETAEGFLFLDPVAPMTIGQGDGPDATLTTGTREEGLVGVFKERDCATERPSANPDLVTSVGNLVSFAESSGMTSICFPDSSLYLWVSRLDLTEAELEAIDLTYEAGQPDEESSTTTSTTTVPPTLSESAGISATEAWTVSEVGIIGTNIGDRPWVLRGAGDLIYVAGGNRETVTALNVQTGEQAWQRSIGVVVVGLMYADDDIVVARGYGLVHAFDPISGETLWSLDLDRQLWPIGAFRSEHGLHVLLDRPTAGDVAPPQVLTVDPEDGSEVWSTELGGVDHPDLDLQPRGSVLVGNQLLVKTTGALHSLEIGDGTVNWMTEFGKVAKSYWPAPPLVADGAVFVADPDGELAYLQLDSGEELWRRPIAEGRVSVVAVTDGLLIYTDGDGVHGAAIATGETRWSHPGDWSAGSLVDGRLVVLSRGSLVGLDPSTGSQLWSQQANVDIPYGVVDLGGLVAAVAEEGIIVVRPETGETAPMIGAGAGSQISATVAELPLIVSNLVIVPHSNGEVTAYSVSG